MMMVIMDAWYVPELGVLVARLAGFEPATRCLEGTASRSLEDAACGLTSSFAVFMMAGCGLRQPDVCLQWLPKWLPGTSLAELIFEWSNIC